MKAAKFHEHYDYADQERKPLLSWLRREVRSPDGKLLEAITAGQRIAYNKPAKKVFLEIKVQREAIVLHLANLEGVADLDGRLSEIPVSHEWHQLSRRAMIQTSDDLERILPFVRMAWVRS